MWVRFLAFFAFSSVLQLAASALAEEPQGRGQATAKPRTAAPTWVSVVKEELSRREILYRDLIADGVALRQYGDWLTALGSWNEQVAPEPASGGGSAALPTTLTTLPSPMPKAPAQLSARSGLADRLDAHATVGDLDSVRAQLLGFTAESRGAMAVLISDSMRRIQDLSASLDAALERAATGGSWTAADVNRWFPAGTQAFSAWARFLRDSPGKVEAFWALSNEEDAASYLLASTKHLTPAEQTWILNVIEAAKLKDKEEAARLVEEVPGTLTDSRFNRLVRALLDKSAPLDSDAAWQWLVDFETLGVKDNPDLASLPRVVGLQPSNLIKCQDAGKGPTSCGVSRDLAQFLAPHFAAYTRKVLLPRECAPEAIRSESAAGRINYHETCYVALASSGRLSMELALAFSVGFNSDGRFSRAYQISEAAIEKGKAGVGVEARDPVLADLFIENARSALALGRERIAISRLTRALALDLDPKARVEALRIEAQALAELGDFRGAGQRMASVAELLPKVTQKERVRVWETEVEGVLLHSRSPAVNERRGALRLKLQLLALMEKGRGFASTAPGTRRSELSAALGRTYEHLGHFALAEKAFRLAYEGYPRSEGTPGQRLALAADYAAFLLRRSRVNEAGQFSRAILRSRNARGGVGSCSDLPVQEIVSRLRLASHEVTQAVSLKAKLESRYLSWMRSCVTSTVSKIRSVPDARSVQEAVDVVTSALASAALEADASEQFQTEVYRILHALKSVREASEAVALEELLSGYEGRYSRKQTPGLPVTDEVDGLDYFSFLETDRKTKEQKSRMLLFHVVQGVRGPTARAYDLGSASAVEEAIVRAKSRVANPHSQPRSSLAVASRHLIPRELRFRPRVRELSISPIGAARTMPFSALLYDEAYLGSRYAVGYFVPGDRKFKKTKKTKQRALIFGDPEFEGRAFRTFPAKDGSWDRDQFWPTLPRLGGARREMEAIRRTLGAWDVATISRDRATESGLRRALQHQYSIMHIATHGLSRSKSANKSDYESGIEQVALALSRRGGRGDASDDGWLTELEVSRLQLRKTELVVLSACETGLGQGDERTGLAGFRRAFLLRSGAHSVVSALWRISDAATSEFMEHFYREIAAGEARTIALFEASRRLRIKHPHPFYWAAFQIHGEAGPL